jgi:hypothetical protein
MAPVQSEGQGPVQVRAPVPSVLVPRALEKPVPVSLGPVRQVQVEFQGQGPLLVRLLVRLLVAGWEQP